MSTTTKIIAITGGIVIGIVLIVLATLGVQSLLQKESAAKAPTPPLMAQVIGVKPHVITVSSTVDKCHQVPITTYVHQPVVVITHNPGIGGTIVGGTLGGLAGSAIHGSARTAAILAGAGLGAYAGHEMQSQNVASAQYKIVPKTIYTSKCGKQTVTKKIEAGYEVTYWYNGTQGMVIMPTPPASNTIPLPTTVPTLQQ